ncbi:MAG: putative TIM-barrel fold metal-dependent hydrolase [Candidatus Azotimanducaceae bacterium]|jgi:predicted TIM-barrel fold metal-dependent hydrolase
MAVDQPFEKQEAWINQVVEAALEPDLPICDAHHHFWNGTGHTGWPYLLEDLQRDTGSGHNIEQTVFLECHAEYKKDGPKHLRSVGEVEFVSALAEASAKAPGATVAAIVGNADVALGDGVEEVLVALEEAGRGRFRGIRYSTAQDVHPPLKQPPSAPMDDANYLQGVRRVGALGYSYDAMIYHPQLADLVEVARACPDTPIVINHLGGILGTGPYKGQRQQILAQTLTQMVKLAACPNTYLKLGGIGMPMMGFRWDKQAIPPTSEELAEPWREPIQAMIDMFGAQRCMFESNYPVDKRGAGYAVLWNAYKRIAVDYSAVDKTNLFHDTAARAYRIPTISNA